MNFDSLFISLMEDFNIAPYYQNANQSGPDIGSTAGQPQNTFPSRVETLNVKLPKKLRKKASIKLSPKGKRAKYRDGRR